MGGGAEGAISRWVEELRVLCQDGGADGAMSRNGGAGGAMSRWVEELRELCQDWWRI